MGFSDLERELTNNDELSSVPPWFSDAMLAPVECGEINVAGVPISYRAWGDRNCKGVLLIHGGFAHARWWDHVAPLLATTHRVVAIDLSGHGDSGRRSSYSLDIWADECQAVIQETGIADHPVLVGHSMGGLVALAKAKRNKDGIGGVISVDCPIRTVAPEVEVASQRGAFGPLRIYSSRSELLARFRTIPAQESLPYIKSYIAENSIKEVEGGWSWKFDPKISDQSWLTPTDLIGIECRVAMFKAEFGVIDEAMMTTIRENLKLVSDFIEVPQSGHAIMLDQPIALVTGIRTMLAAWEL